MYTATTWVAGTTALSATHLNNLETEYTQATQSFNQDLFSPFVLYGLMASKDSITANLLDVTAGVAYVLQSDSTTYRIAPTSSTQSTTTPSSTYHLYLQPAGTWYWSTSNSPASGSLFVAQVTTDGSGNILAVTDERNLYASLLPNSTGAVAFGPLGSSGGMAIDAMGTTLAQRQGFPAAPTATPGAGSGLGVGNYGYRVTFVSFQGETPLGTAGTCTTTSANKQVALTGIVVGPNGVLARKIYRTAVGGSSYFLLTTINDNTTTSYTDSTADGSLGAAAPTHSTMGGSFWKHGAGVLGTAIYSDGAFYSDSGAFTTDASGNLTLNSIASVGGQASTGSFGTPVIVAQKVAQNITGTSLTTILTYAVPVSGLYRVSAYAWFGNTTNQDLTLQVAYVDASSSSSTTTYMCNDSGLPLNGSNSCIRPNGIQALPIAIYAANSANIVVSFQDPGGSPADYVTVIIERMI